MKRERKRDKQRERDREIGREKARSLKYSYTHCDEPARTHALAHLRTYKNINIHTQTYDMRMYRGLFVHTLHLHTYICAYIQTCLHKYI